MTWVDLSSAFAYGTKLTSTQMQNLRDNIAAAFAKDSGAPELADDYVLLPMVGDGVTALVPLESVPLVGSGYTDLTHITSNYGSYEIHFNNVIPSNDNVDIRLRTSADSGSTFDDTIGDYKYGLDTITYNGSASHIVTEDDDSGHIKIAETVGSAAYERGLCGRVKIFTPAHAGRTHMRSVMTYTNAAGYLVDVKCVGRTKLTTAVNAIRFYWSGGDFESGTISLYGIKFN